MVRARLTGADPGQVLRCIQTKLAIIAEVVSGRLPLLEAAARFHREGAAGQPGAVPENGEDCCREVIGWAHLALSERPERAEAVSRQLEQQLRSHLDRHGTVCLRA
jgi:hypothetical protein